MAEIRFNFRLADSLYNLPNGYIYDSKLVINQEWSMQCLWSQNAPIRSEFLKFYRESTGQGILVFGTLTLKRTGYNSFQRKVMQFVEAGRKAFVIELDNCLYFEHDETINFTITGCLMISVNEPTKKCGQEAQSKSLLCLSDDYECLLDTQKTFFSDVEITCGTVSFPAHKNILCARSPVFAAMFSTEMKEKQNNKVDITDLSPEILKTMLIYIYSGKTGEFSFESAGELLFAADKYQLQDLQRICCHFLKSCLSVQNVLKTLVLGELHDKELKSFAMDLICNKCEEFEVLEKTEEWKNLREKRPSLAMDVLSGLVISTNKKLKNHK